MRHCLNGILARRFVVMLSGLIFLGLGVALFTASGMGIDPSNSAIMAIGDRVGIRFSLMFVLCYTFFFAIELLLQKELIGIGTFMNWFCVGFIAEHFMGLIERYATIPDSFAAHLGIMCAGVVILSLGCSLYQTSNLGIAPYDSLSIMICKRKHYHYFWCRVLTDSLCVAAALALGGSVGIGTVFCALGMGPFVSFFDVLVSRKLCGN